MSFGLKNSKSGPDGPSFSVFLANDMGHRASWPCRASREMDHRGYPLWGVTPMRRGVNPPHPPSSSYSLASLASNYYYVLLRFLFSFATFLFCLRQKEK